MRIELNGKITDTAAAMLADLLAERGFDPASVATALDGNFVPAAQRASAALHPGARVEVLTPMQGG